jgi:hypothetical protein
MGESEEVRNKSNVYDPRNGALFAIGEDVSWHSHYGKQFVGCSKKSKLKLTNDPTTHLQAGI